MGATHTPGPWRWELNEQSKDVQLVGGRPTFDKIVVDFVRYGMGGAAPQFNSHIAGNEYNVMERAEVYGVEVEGRRHHASWFKGINHPDANLIAAAPELLEVVDFLIKSFSAAGISADLDSNDPGEELMAKAVMAYAKATGSQP